MVITCPSCKSRYRIDPSVAKREVAKVKCPECEYLFEIQIHADKDAEQARSKSSDRRPQVLIVDDANFFREMIKDIIKDLPIDVETASDGLQAWEIILNKAPQMVLLDLNIPGRSGKQILHDLRSHNEYDGTKVIIMSGVDRDDVTAIEMRNMGADGFLNKSFKPAELQNHVRTLLGL